MLLQIQSVYYSKKDNYDIVYYPQVLIEQCGYSFFSNNKIIHPNLILTDSDPDDNNESEQEFNKDTLCDE